MHQKSVFEVHWLGFRGYHDAVLQLGPDSASLILPFWEGQGYKQSKRSKRHKTKRYTKSYAVKRS